jgi:hypothetical protein
VSTWRRVSTLVAAASVVATMAATPAAAVSRGIGSRVHHPNGGVTGTGSATISPGSVVTPVPTSLKLTYTAADPLTDGVVDVTVPTGWTMPSITNSTASTGVLGAVGSTISVIGVNLTTGQSLTITYGIPTSLVTPSAGIGGFERFDVSMSPTSSGALNPVVDPPSVFNYVKAPPALFRYLTTTPPAVFNNVGVTATSVSIFPPYTKHGQPPFVTRVHGARVPDSFYSGAEYCPYCATTTWALAVALSRFGHFNQLYEMTSSPVDVAPNTPSFTFHLSKYTSPFLAFTGYEEEGPTMRPLDRPPRAILALIHKYNTQYSWPFADVGNLLFVDQASFDPSAMSGLSRNEIATHLRVTSNPVTRAIISTANLLSAGICASDGEKPATVCRSTGVTKADLALHLPHP